MTKRKRPKLTESVDIILTLPDLKQWRFIFPDYHIRVSKKYIDGELDGIFIRFGKSGQLFSDVLAVLGGFITAQIRDGVPLNYIIEELHRAESSMVKIVGDDYEIFRSIPEAIADILKEDVK